MAASRSKDKCLLLGLLCVLQMLFCESEGSEYYVMANGGAPCPENAASECHNLSHYASNPDLYFSSDTTFSFLKGTHFLESEKLLLIAGVKNLTLQGLGEMEPGFHWTVQQSNVMITCVNSTGGLALINCSDITVRTITLFDCGGLAGDLIENRTLWYRFNANGQTLQSLLLAYITGLSMFQVSVQNCTGRGLSALNTFNVDISQSYFSQNNLDTYYDQVCSTNISSDICMGGNAQFLYEDNADCSTASTPYYTLNITESSFSFGVDLYRHNFALGSGLGISLYYSSGIGIEVNLASLNLYGNTGYYGANLYVTITNTVNHFSVTMTNIESTSGNSVYPLPDKIGQRGQHISGPKLSNGAGFLYWSSIWFFGYCQGVLLPHKPEQLTVSNSMFSRNQATTGAGVYLDVYAGLPGVQRQVLLENTTSTENTGVAGVGLSIKQYTSFSLEAPLQVILHNVSVSDNQLMQIDVVPSSAYDFPSKEEEEDYGHFDLNDGIDGTALDLTEVTNATLSGLFVGNHGFAGIHTYSSVMTIKGEATVIQNNTGKDGGGCLLYGNTYIILKDGANLTFVNNSAVVGGAMFVEEIFAKNERPNCFFQVDDPDSWLNQDEPNVTVFFRGNHAFSSGDVLYSTSSNLLDCEFASVSYYQNRPRQVFQDIFMYDSPPYRAVSSSPVRVCFCNGQDLPNCSRMMQTASVVPGESFTRSVVSLGLFLGMTPGIINIMYYANGTSYNQELSKVPANCSELTFTVNSASEQTRVVMTADDPDTIRNIPIVIDVTLLPCPPGFTLDEIQGKCDCSSQLQALGNVTCNITTGNITRSGEIWIAYQEDENCTVGVSHSLFDYCNSNPVTFNIASPNPQCKTGRSGTLCGQCEGNLSLELGSNNCRKCSNAYLALILPFMLAGFVLVVFIIVLNLTVSVGTINGLIFYANVVKINESKFFPDGPIPVLSQFISWLNLDLGISTCFYDGMDAYAKTWLQFVFPFYIWMLVALLVFLARRFERVAWFLGDNAVPVLCTLFLLSYTKVLRTVIQALQLADLTCGDQHWKVWSVDGTVEYFEPKHLVLFLFALFVLFFVAIPYTGLTLLIPLLESYLVRYKTFSWLVRLKPYFDANGGPYKDKFRFWPGLLLLVRLVLAFTVPYSSSVGDQWTVLVLTISVMALAMVLSGVYEKWYLNLLDTWSLINIVLFNNGLYPEVSVGLALVTFAGIVLYHVYMQLWRRPNWRRYVSLSEERKQSLNSSRMARRLTAIKSNSSSKMNTGLLDSAVVTMRRESLLMNYSTTGSYDEKLHLNLSDSTDRQQEEA